MRIASWIREKDIPFFERAFAFAPDAQLENAAFGTADLAEADGLLLTGGGDISAGYLGQPVDDPALIRGASTARDAWEFAALGTARERGIPILGICRGHQVLNVAGGGTLLLDIPGHDFSDRPGDDVQPLRHAGGLPPWRRYGKVNSTHHQAVERIAPGFVAEAWHRDDGIIEQMSLPGYPFCVGVQYHPERGSAYAPLFEAFAAKARG